jgi:hypothetical protein
MTKENRFEGLMGVVGKNKNAQTSQHTDVQKPLSRSNAETSKSLDIQTSKIKADDSPSDISASKHLNVQTSKKAKSANPDYTRTTVYLPKKMHKKLKAIALDEEREMSSILGELIETWLSSRK